MKIASKKVEGIEAPSTECIDLDVSRHCIQTATRRRYEKILARCLRSKTPDRALERQVDLLQQALETLDFSLMRSRWPELAGGRKADVGLSRAEGRLLVHIDANRFPAPLRKDTGGK
jgi:hypothetical protein